MSLTNQTWRWIAYLFGVYFSVTAILIRPWELLLISSSQKCFHVVSCENYGSLLMSFHYLHFSKAGVAGIYSHKPAGCGCFKCCQLSRRCIYFQKRVYSGFDQLECHVGFFPLIFKNFVLVRQLSITLVKEMPSKWGMTIKYTFIRW